MQKEQQPFKQTIENAKKKLVQLAEDARTDEEFNKHASRLGKITFWEEEREK